MMINKLTPLILLCFLKPLYAFDRDACFERLRLVEPGLIFNLGLYRNVFKDDLPQNPSSFLMMNYSSNLVSINRQYFAIKTVDGLLSNSKFTENNFLKGLSLMQIDKQISNFIDTLEFVIKLGSTMDDILKINNPEQHVWHYVVQKYLSDLNDSLGDCRQ
jgi:hypothetical protein